MKKIIAIALVLVMVLGSFAEVFAASGNDNAVRLAKTEGTVAVKDANGVKKTIPENGKLLTGYVVATGKDGYAYITQGDKKLIKLDLNTTVSIKQGKNKKKIEVFLETGNIFVNVSEKLGSDEELNIKTTNTQTGVRGTMLEVSVVVTEISAPLENKLEGLGGVVKDREVSFGSPNDTGSSKGVSGEVNLASKQDALNSQNKQVGTNINLIEGFVTSSIFFPGVGLEGSSQQPAKIVNIAAGQSLNAQLDQGSNTNTVETGEFKLDELRGSTLSELLNIEPERLQTLEKVFISTKGKAILQEITEQAEKNTATDEAEAKQNDSNPLTIENNASSNQQNNQQVNNLYISNNSVDTGSDSGTPYIPPTYSVTLDLGQDGNLSGGDWTGTVKSGLASGAVVTLPSSTEVVAPTGKEFAGWYLNSDFSGSSVTSVTMRNSNQTVYAKFTLIECQVSLVFNNTYGTLTDWDDWNETPEGASRTMPYGDTLPVLSGDDYNFVGWYDNANFDGNTVTSVAKVTGNTYYAKFIPKNYVVTLHLDGGSFATVPEGWTDKGTYIEKVVPVGTDLDLSSITPSTLPAGVRVGFVGWYSMNTDGDGKITTWNEKVTSIPTTQTESVELYAKYSGTGTITLLPSLGYAINGALGKYASQFDSDASGSVSISYDYGNYAEFPFGAIYFYSTDDNDTSLYTVTSWYDTNGNSISTATGAAITMTGNRTFYANVTEGFEVSLCLSVSNDFTGGDEAFSVAIDNQDRWIKYNDSTQTQLSLGKLYIKGTTIVLPTPLLKYNGEIYNSPSFSFSAWEVNINDGPSSDTYGPGYNLVTDVNTRMIVINGIFIPQPT